VDIVPVALIGTYELLPMDTYHIKCRPIEMRVGRPISTANLKLREMEQLTARVREELERLYYGSEKEASG
jgi:1-acyl-sn-glycerol-3-phosphate acyltransferase